jgi:hypothetical protein
MFTPIVRFATRNPGLYFALCGGVGLVIRWYMVGQDVHRFINPLAPLFA